jgi:hypothetical protein
MFTRIDRRGFRFSSWRRNTTEGSTQEKLTLSQRLKKLSKEYGWSAVGVYLTLSVLDFPFCFLLVRVVGTDTIGKFNGRWGTYIKVTGQSIVRDGAGPNIVPGKIEHYVVSTAKQFIPESVRQKWHEYWQSIKSKEVETLGSDGISDKVEMAGWGVEEAQERNKEEASEYTHSFCPAHTAWHNAMDLAYYRRLTGVI